MSLQEVSEFHVQSPGDFLVGNPTPAGTPVMDYLDMLLEALAARGASYTVAAKTRNFDIELPIYPEADRRDYVDTHRDPNEETTISPEGFVVQAKEWVAQGVQIIGGCCGIEIEFIAPLRDALPTHLPAP